MALKKFLVKYQVTVSHDDESKDVSIDGERIYEATSADKAREMLMDDWDNGMESDFIDADYIMDDDIFDICMDVIDAKPFKEKKK